MANRGRKPAEQTIGKEPRPGRVLERHELHPAAELGKYGLLLAAFPAFAERDQINLVITPQRSKQVERTLVSAAVHRKRYVGVYDQDSHG